MIEKIGNYTFDNIRVVMVNTTEPGNIGASARAMKNMGLHNLYLVNPSGYPSATATARASSADDILASAVVCNSLAEALDGVHLVIGASARQRSIKWSQVDVVGACAKIRQITIDNSKQVAVVFGTEHSGLSNEELDLCQVLMTIPTSANYSSLNVSAAVQVFAYQNFVLQQKNTKTVTNLDNLADFNDLESFYNHLQQVLVHINYFADSRPQNLLMRRLRHFFNRANPKKDEIAILRGVLKNIKPFIR